MPQHQNFFIGGHSFFTLEAYRPNQLIANPGSSCFWFSESVGIPSIPSRESPVIIRKLDDKSLRLYSIVENLHSLNLGSIEREGAIHQRVR